ncbi:hypothetical protein GPECTOR_7g1062 [Gonium pectorale]|uniref:Uncharacterized protein n=1 Tax=Gonium pectorale TaxID=33097 RepID=A0A150GV14_GONPE|nr:hypothetical protein GPECTOR_7g1062 [Gonium pectorale]|eukprot:KXZ53170.1 hypothetical protein GPECTOR_7g1062 [Gonium pectorale]
MHSYYNSATGGAPPAGHGPATAGAGATAGSAGSASSAALLRNALYGVRPGAAAPPHGGTVLYRSFNAAPRDKSILAAAVDDALMSPDTDPIAVANAVDPMMVDYNAAASGLTAGSGIGAEVLADMRHGNADGAHRLNMGVTHLATVGDPMAPAPAAQPSSKAALYGNYQAAAGSDVRDLRRLTAAQLHQMTAVRQLQARQQQQHPHPAEAPAAVPPSQQQPTSAAAAAMPEPATAQLYVPARSAAQAQVLAAAAEVAQQVAARQAAMQQQQQQQLRAAVEQCIAAAAAPSGAAAASAAQSALYKRTAAAAAATTNADAANASVLYKRPALGAANGATAAGPPAASIAAAVPPVTSGTALYGVYCADRSAATAAAAAVSREVQQRAGAAAAAAAAPAVAAGPKASQQMAISPQPGPRAPEDESSASDTGFLDCHEELGEEPMDERAPDSSGTSSGSTSLYTAIGSSGGSVSSYGGTSIAAAAAAAAAGAQRCRPRRATPNGSAVCPYGPVYCPVVYSDVSSPNALALANEIMKHARLPGGVTFLPLSVNSVLFYNGVHWGFSAFALALGSSYFQRLIEMTPTLSVAVYHSPQFCAYAENMSDEKKAALAAAHPDEVMHKDGLRSILFTCAYLATKVVDRMPHTDMLRRMLSMLYEQPVSREEAHSVELKCLEGLKYRLGPFFYEDELNGEPACCDIY